MAFPEVIHQSRYTVQIQSTFFCEATLFQIFSKKTENGEYNTQKLNCH